MNLKSVLVVLWITALVAVSTAQQGMRMMGNPAANPPMLLTRDDVRTDLQITDDQKSKLYDLGQSVVTRFTEASRASYEDAKARSKAFENIGKKIAAEVSAILTPGQQTRLKEIAIQLGGFSAAALPDIQKELTITAEQKSKISDLTARQQQATASSYEKLRNGEIQFADVQETSKKNQKILNEEIGKILTQSQKDKLKTLGGKTFVPTPDPNAGGSR